MTTWHCQDQQQQQDFPTRRRSSNKNSAANRHSIADILGWTRVAMASDVVPDSVMVTNSSSPDEPLDLSLDKSKCRRDRRDEINVNAAPATRAGPIKRLAANSKGEADESGSDGGDETEEGSPWGVVGGVQPHLQMAANFSQVLQYYLTAARLWQTSEAMRCQESQQRTEDSSEGNDGDDGHGSDTASHHPALLSSRPLTMSDSSAISPIAPSQPKRRKKDQLIVDLGDPAGNGNVRPRKTRTTFTGKQLFELERIFEQKKYLSSNERQEVARLLNVTGSQIKIWFQNRRTKWKKQDPSTAAELAQLKSASRSQQQQSQQHHQAGASKSGKSADLVDDDMNSDASSSAAPSPSPL